MIIVSVDIGYINMGLSRCVVDEEYNTKFTHAFKVDITRLTHRRVAPQDCKIPHTCETCDRVAHFIQEYEPFFEEADHVLLERQPPMGLKDIEALIMTKYRGKTKLISPNKMHKHYGISRFSYEERKVKTEEIAFKHVGHLSTYQGQERKHDMADSVCICNFFVDGIRRKNPKRLPFEEFRFLGKSRNETNLFHKL